jgi:hypothetical protein|tara:strand:- start:1666 stop:1914 length:249 start_codon:yes stop_codon:yes gene_type:complete
MAKWIKQPTTVNNIYTAGDANYVHDQGTPSATWVIAHNLNKKCAVTVVDSANRVVVGEINYNSVNQVTLNFSGSFSGKAFFN